MEERMKFIEKLEEYNKLKQRREYLKRDMGECKHMLHYLEDVNFTARPKISSDRYTITLAFEPIPTLIDYYKKIYSEKANQKEELDKQIKEMEEE